MVAKVDEVKSTIKFQMKKVRPPALAGGAGRVHILLSQNSEGSSEPRTAHEAIGEGRKGPCFPPPRCCVLLLLLVT
jgi:hypothetical protein